MDTLPEQVIEENKQLREENARLKAEALQMEADIKKLTNCVFQVLDLFGLLDEDKQKLNPVYFPEDGSEGESPIGTVINSFFDLGAQYGNAKLHAYFSKTEGQKREDDFKQRMAFIWDIKDIYNRLAKYHGQQNFELPEAPQTIIKKME